MLLIIFVWGSVLAAPYISRADDLKLDAIEMKTNYFGGRPAGATFRLSSPDAFTGTLRWHLMFNKRILQRAEQSIEVNNRFIVFHLDLDFPPVKENIVVPVDFALTVYDEKNGRAAVNYRERLWIFAEHAFHGRHKQLKNINIYLFDPRKRTSTLFSSADIPFKPVGSLDALSSVSNGLVIIGEGLALGKCRGLTEAITTLASAGNTVLCLAPDSGAFPLPLDLDNECDAVHLRHSDMILELDKHLDAALWSPGRTDGAGITGIRVSVQRNQMVGEVMQNRGWPWMEIDYGKKGGRLVFCGFNLLKAWERSPAPRYLLSGIIHDLTDTPIK